jgi:hypothetical protein
MGACCVPNGPCFVTTQETCFGAYQGDGTACVPNPCPPVESTGACCLPNGGCFVTTQGNCEGVYQGDNTLCNPNSCPIAGLGACEIPPQNGGGCMLTTLDDCNLLYQGEFLGLGTVCPPGRGLRRGRGGGVAERTLSCEKNCMEAVSVFLAACDAQGSGVSFCAPAANMLFQDCLSECAASCDKSCMTASSASLTVCLSFRGTLEVCLGAAKEDFGACLAACPRSCTTGCLDAASAELADCLLAGGDPVECGRTADANIESCLAACRTPFRRGDVNTDGTLDISDPVSSLRCLFGAGACSCADAADSNDDGRHDIADVSFALNCLFGRGVCPPPPGFAGCAPDPTADGLSCESFSACD